MTPIKQRSIIFLQDPSYIELFVKSIEQDDRDITIPASTKFKVSRQEKITIPYSEIDDRMADLFEKVQLMDVRFSENLRGCKDSPGETGQTIFNDFENMNELGLSIEVAPQTADSFEQYKYLSELTIDQVMRMLRIQDDNSLIFFQEWFKKNVFRIEDQGCSNIAQMIALRLWNALLKRNVELPVRLPDLETLSGVELVLGGKDKQEASLFLYWQTVNRPTIISKKYVRQETAELESELAIFYSTSKESWDYNPPLSGLRMKIDKEKYTDDNKMLKFVPTMVYASPTHNTLYGYQSKHELLHPIGMHPTYKISILNGDAKFPFEPLQSHGEGSCSLMFQLDVPKQIILDKYQLEHLKGKSFIDFHVHNGGMNLELPDYRIEEWGGSLTAELDESYITSHNESFEIPLHLRYGKPLGSYEEFSMPKGELYWQCQMKDANQIVEAEESFYNEKNRLGIDKFGQNMMFYHVQDMESSCSNSLQLKIPTADLKDAYSNELWTLIFVIAGTLYIIVATVRK
ncbi:hypothetical protein FOA43_003391 [Brettanomyces nanus]|uniref:Protein PBN1 n=1 Tax=Eeniella nana TaxID=13502 RepID=A0A875S6S1_EENNA|nr:uncharacterized protein FOA43_003391 [Brettanomyces nanus]QPG76005.1 hypothetical protein FOA43_003391 [Brettanomyces nanus]